MLPTLASAVFDLVVVGSGGGPDESNLSAYLLKPHAANWSDGVVALEAGSGQGTLARLLQKNPDLLGREHHGENKLRTASQIYSFVRAYLLTHAHLDHINSLVVSAGSLRGPRKRVYALKQTLNDLELVFSDRIWPNLASWKEDDDSFKLLYSTLSPNGIYRPIMPDVSVRTMPINHGKNEHGHYDSAAFFVRHDPSAREFLFFGDVEPDSIAETPQNINIWQAAAPRIPDQLSAIFIECSYPSGRSDAILYGHLTPEHLCNELTALAREVVLHRAIAHLKESRRRPPRKKQKRNSFAAEELTNALAGLKIYIMHCKDDMDGDLDRPAKEVIIGQVRALVEKRGLGAEIHLAEQGTRIEI